MYIYIYIYELPEQFLKSTFASEYSVRHFLSQFFSLPLNYLCKFLLVRLPGLILDGFSIFAYWMFLLNYDTNDVQESINKMAR